MTMDQPLLSGTERAAELDEGRMPFLEHLRELRTRVRNCALALLAAFLVTYNFSNEILAFLIKPLNSVWQELAATNDGLGQEAFYFTKLHEPFWVFISVSFWAALFVASPIIFHQIWKFIAPGLYKRERRYGVVFAVLSAILFIGGAYFCYEAVLEAVFRFLLGYSTENIGKVSRAFDVEYQVGQQVALQPLLTIGEYLGFAKRLLIGFGLVFELPLAIFFLSFAGVVTHRSLWSFNRWFVVLSFVIGAMLTPPDVYSQLLMAGPLIVLYQISIAISWLVTRAREKREAMA